MSNRITNDTDETIIIEPGETIKVTADEERKRALSSRPTEYIIKKVFEDWG